MKRHWTVLVIVLISVIVTTIITAPIVYFVMYKQSYDKQGELKRQITDLEFELYSLESQQTTKSADDDVDSAGTKRFSSKNFGLAFNYPAEWIKPANTESSDISTLTFTKDGQYVFIIRIDSGSSAVENLGDVFFGATKNGENNFLSGKADEFLFPDGYADANNSTPPYIAERMVQTGKVFTFEFYGKAELSDEARAVMNSLEFVE